MVLVKGSDVADFVAHYESEIVCFESGIVTNPATPASAIADMDLVGYPVTGDSANGFELAINADTPTGFIATKGLYSAAAGAVVSTKPLRVLARGPAAINEGKLPAADIAGTDFVGLAAKAVTLGLTLRNEPPQTDVQTD